MYKFVYMHMYMCLSVCVNKSRCIHVCVYVFKYVVFRRDRGIRGSTGSSAKCTASGSFYLPTIFIHLNSHIYTQLY